jgi:hypothetical protein
MCLFLGRYSCVPKNIKKDNPHKVMSVFEVWKFSTMNCMLLKSIRTRLLTNRAYLINIK